MPRESYKRALDAEVPAVIEGGKKSNRVELIWQLKSRAVIVPRLPSAFLGGRADLVDSIISTLLYNQSIVAVGIMLARRITQHSTRRLLAQQPTLSRFTPPAAIAASRLRPQARSVAFQPSATEPHAQTQPAKPSDAYAILAAQRLNRPVSPHLSIYQPQMTWYASITNRITGCVLSGGLYIFGAAYLVSPLLGWHLESAAMAEWFGSFGAVTKGVMKFGISLPFTFHSWNGIRHLVWDTGREFGNKQVEVTGWIVVALTVVSSTALAFVGMGDGKSKEQGVGGESWKGEFKNWKG